MVPDWCEPNFVWSSYIAEWWNTWSSFAFIVVGSYGLMKTQPCASLRRYRMCYYFTIIVGVGSALFHSTLTRWGQISDEVSMIMCVYAGLFSVTKNTRESVYVIGCGALALIVYSFASFYWFLFLFGATLCVLVFTIWKFSRRCTDIRVTNLVSLAILIMGIAFFCFWLPEHLLCVIYPVETRGFIQVIPLHALWHVLMSMGIYLMILGGILHSLGPKRRVAPTALPTIV